MELHGNSYASHASGIVEQADASRGGNSAWNGDLQIDSKDEVRMQDPIRGKRHETSPTEPGDQARGASAASEEFPVVKDQRIQSRLLIKTDSSGSDGFEQAGHDQGAVVPVEPEHDRPQTPLSAPPDFKRPRILMKKSQAASSSKPANENVSQGVDLLALKRELLLEEHEARMTSLAEEHSLRCEALREEAVAWKAKQSYYKEKRDRMRAKNAVTVGAGHRGQQLTYERPHLITPVIGPPQASENTFPFANSENVYQYRPSAAGYGGTSGAVVGVGRSCTDWVPYGNATEMAPAAKEYASL